MTRPRAIRCSLALLVYLSVLALLTGTAQASAHVEAVVEPPSISVCITLENVNASLYGRMRSHPEAFNETTVPEAIKAFMLANGYERVNYTKASISFDDSTRTVKLAFRLMGEDIMSFHYNRTTMARIYELNVLWRKADVVARAGTEELFRLNFSTYFSTSLKKWEQVNYTLPNGEIRIALRLESKTGNKFDSVFLIILPRKARVLEVRRDDLVFELPPTPGELFMASPFWPLIAVIAITAAAAFSRKAMIRWVRPGGASPAVARPERSSQTLSQA